MIRFALIAWLCASSAAVAAPAPGSPAQAAPLLPPPLPTTPMPAAGFNPAPKTGTAVPDPDAVPSRTAPPPPAAVPMPVKAPAAKDPAPAQEPAAVIPQPYPRSRYELSWKKNPFLLKTAPVVQTKESWATDYALTSIAKLSGVYRVSIKNKKTGESKRLSEASNAEAEFKIVKVNLQPDRKSSSVEVERGGEKATLTYDVTMTTPQGRGGVPGQPGGARPGMPVIPGQPGGNVPLPSMRTTSTTAPGGSVAGSYGGGAVAGAGPSSAGGYQRTQGGAMGGYSGSPPGGYYGGGGFAGGVGGGGAGSSASTTPANPAAGTATSSRLGALAPRTGAGGAQNTLIPNTTVTANATNAGTTVPGITLTTDENGNVTATPGSTTTSSSTSSTPTSTTGTDVTPVTRRRSLVPAPVVNQ